MVARRDALFNLASLLRRSSASEDEVSEAGLLQPDDDILVASDTRLAGPLSWSATVQRTGGDDNDFLAHGEVSGQALLECRRCLTDVVVDVEAEFFYPMAYRPSDDPALRLGEEDGDDLLVFGQPVVDFAPLLSQVFAIDVPLTALCREDCKGLSLDGVNLNEHPEAAQTAAVTEPDKDGSSPFAALKDLDLQD